MTYRAHPARYQATRHLIRQWRRTAEHLRVPLLFARDKAGCNDVEKDYTMTGKCNLSLSR